MSGTLKTFILMAAMTALFGGVGSMLGGQTGMLIALLIAGGMNFWSYFNSDKAVLAHYKAVPAPDGHQLTEIVRELSLRANLPMPKVYIINNEQPNAFATGRNPQHAAVAASTGLLQTLSPDEVRGVMAHELAHIKNHDTLTMTVTASIAGAISMLGNFMMFSGGRGGDGQNRNPLFALLAVMLAPLAASIVQMAISRAREYEADRIGSEISGTPRALAKALATISGKAELVHNIEAEQNPATAHMFIINPLHRHGMEGLFSTHPSTESRIEKLLELESKLPHAIKPNSLPQTDQFTPADDTFAPRDGDFNPWK